ncbi:hypothetical protein [Neobacillus thermocopriae]|uniref:Uncharacterized protein n=1 Tax=Neobacillus thermocopriae TaxID=1215031 RepID=A0A6B3TUR3_9BACI|nr:hypothetical protein [Neobacillus thermocopriae]
MVKNYQNLKQLKEQKNLTTFKNKAKEIVASANPKAKPIHEIDSKKRKYYHWHPFKRTPKMYSFLWGCSIG